MGGESLANIPAEPAGLLSSLPAQRWQALMAGRRRGWTLGSGRPLLNLTPYGLCLSQTTIPRSSRSRRGLHKTVLVSSLLSCR